MNIPCDNFSKETRGRPGKFLKCLSCGVEHQHHNKKPKDAKPKAPSNDEPIKSAVVHYAPRKERELSPKFWALYNEMLATNGEL